MEDENKVCRFCLSPLDEEGICTRKGCPKRRIQLRLKKAQKMREEEGRRAKKPQ